MWGNTRGWLPGGALDDDKELLADLIGVEYGYTVRDGGDAIILERKENMKARGLARPDIGDALALTFAYPIERSDRTRQIARKPMFESKYNPFAGMWDPNQSGHGNDYWSRFWRGPGYR